jgi:uncharacterized sulfatase
MKPFTMNIFPMTPFSTADSSPSAAAMRRVALMRRAFLMTGMALTALPLAAPPAQAQTAPKPKPNVLFISIDDLNTNLGTYGNSVVKTPNIDRLASWSVQFNRAYCQLPWCSPSRASLLTGLRPDTTRVFNNDTKPLQYLPGVIVLPQHFKANGYFSARVGKIFHDWSKPEMTREIDSPAVWDVSRDGRSPLPNAELNKRKVFSDNAKVRGTSPPQGMSWSALDVRDEELGDGQVARQIAALMEAQERGSAGKDANGQPKPWFLAAGFRKPHQKWEAPKKYFDLYDPTKIPLPQEPPLSQQKIPQAARGWKIDPAKPPATDAQRREAIRAYYASISFMDAQVGVLLDQVEKLKLRDNTIIMLWSDHGYNLGERGGMWEKVKLFDNPIRVPLLIAAPGMKQGQASPRTVELLDLYPTLVDLCGLPDPGAASPWKLQGVSLRPLLSDPKAAWDRPAYSVLGNQQTNTIRARSVSTERWHYMDYGAGATLLYDHSTDPDEYRNLSGEPQVAAVEAQMKALLEKAAREHRQKPTPPQLQAQAQTQEGLVPQQGRVPQQRNSSGARKNRRKKGNKKVGAGRQ